MVDVVPKSKRSQVMAAIRSHGNKANELISIFHAKEIKGWLVLRLWEHELANALRIAAKISRALGEIV